MRYLGTVDSVEVRRAGSFTLGATLTGATSLPVKDMADFHEDGGSCVLGGITLDYTAALSDVDAGDSLTLAAALDFDVPDRTSVYAEPKHLVKIAWVVLDAHIDGDPVRVDIPSGHFWTDARLAEGVAGGQRIEVESIPGPNVKYRPTDLPGADPLPQADYLDPNSTIPPDPLRASFQNHPDALTEAVPAGALAGGDSSASFNFKGQVKLGPMIGGADGFSIMLPSGAVPVTVSETTIRIGDVEVDATFVKSLGALLAGVTKIAAGGELILDAEIDPPSLPPNPYQDWPTLNVLELGAGFPSRRRSLAIDGDNGRSFTLMTSQAEPDVTRLVVFDFDPDFTVMTGMLTEQLRFSGPTAATVYRVGWSKTRSMVVTLERDAFNSAWLMRYWNYSPGSLTYDHEWVVTQLGTDETPLPAMSVMDASGVENIVVARSRTDGKVDLHRYAAETFDTTITTTDVFDLGDLVSAAKIGEIVVLAGATNYTAPAGNPHGWDGRPVLPVVELMGGIFGSPGPTLGWLVVANGDTMPAGIACVDGDTNIRTYYLSGRSAMFADHSNPFRTFNQWISVTWFDSVHGYESDPCEAVLVPWKPGGRCTFTLGAPPAGSTIDSVRFYAGADTMAGVFPGWANMHLQATSSPGSYFASIFDLLLASANPPTPGSGHVFTGAGAAAVMSADGSTIIDGSYSSPYDLATRIAALESGGVSSGPEWAIFIDAETGDITFDGEGA